MLTEILTYRFTGPPENALDTWERLVKTYSELTGDTIADNIRIGLVMSNLADECVKNHLQLNASRIDSWRALRDEVREICAATQLWQGAAPMDIDATFLELARLARAAVGAA